MGQFAMRPIDLAPVRPSAEIATLPSDKMQCGCLARLAVIQLVRVADACPPVRAARTAPQLREAMVSHNSDPIVVPSASVNRTARRAGQIRIPHRRRAIRPLVLGRLREGDLLAGSAATRSCTSQMAPQTLRPTLLPWP